MSDWFCILIGAIVGAGALFGIMYAFRKPIARIWLFDE